MTIQFRSAIPDYVTILHERHEPMEPVAELLGMTNAELAAHIANDGLKEWAATKSMKESHRLERQLVKLIKTGERLRPQRYIVPSPSDDTSD